MNKKKEFIDPSDWTKNWHASIAVKISAITLWPTIIVVFIALFFLLDDLEENILQSNQDTATKLAYHASSLWPESDSLGLYQKLEILRHDYHTLNIQGFELTNQQEIFRIGEFELLETYIDLPLPSASTPNLAIRVFFLDAHKQAETLRNQIIGAVLLALILFAAFLSLATHIILDKPLKVLVDATQKISHGHQHVRVDTLRKDEFGTLSRFFNKMVDNLIEQKNLEYEAKTDFLTGLANRRHFDETIKYELRRNARVHNPLTLIMCDVDFFKQYNDLYNHVAGDLCLKHIARTLESVCNRAGDLVARYGGEEFVIILPNTDKEIGIKIALSLSGEIKNLKIPHSGSTVSQYVTLSIGVATIEDSGVTLDATNMSELHIIEAADKALYKAKQNGRDRVEVIDVEVSADGSNEDDSDTTEKDS